MSLNAHIDWDSFNSHWYSDHNYRILRDDDHQILELVREYFAGSNQRDGSAIDVGAGSNLYPALSMLPFCSSLDLWEYSSSNVQWLEEQTRSFDHRWEQFWAVLATHQAYAGIDNPRARLQAQARVKQASVFDLPEREWSMGTMFFVACSLSADIAEFERAVTCFVRSLTVDAPFAVAVMVDSSGYHVEGQWFPAVAIGEGDVRRSMTSIAYDLQVHPITTRNPLRDGYGGMLLVTGRSGF